MELLDYETQMFLELFQDDALVVLAKGIGIERLLINLIKTYTDPGNLVLIIGTNSAEEEYLTNRLSDLNVTPLPKIITSDVGIKDRYEVYMDGGVLFVSSRILVVDMLVDRIPIDLITGIIVFRAHKILESCQEAFILRLFRMKNNKGFIKALSSNPCAFTRGFAQVQRIMRNLFVKNLFLWPRFHAIVASSIEKAKSEVFEMHVPMTHAMTSIQMALLDLMSVTVKELKHTNPSLDTDDLTVENAIAKSFDKIIKYQLEPVWHQLSTKSKRLISDLKFLRSVLQYVTQQDCVTFYNLLKSIKENVTVGTQMSDWLFLDASDNLFMHAKTRVLSDGKKTNDKKSKPKIILEENSKWNALTDILDELSTDTKDEKQMVIIVVNDDVISKQLREVVTYGSKDYLKYMLCKKFPDIKHEVEDNSEASKQSRKKKVKKGEQTLTQMDISNKEQNSETEDKTETSKDDLAAKYPNLFIEFYPLKHFSGNHFHFQNLCDLHHPPYFILYDGDMEIIRRIELYQALNHKKKIKVYFLVYTGSAEEQCFLTSLRREKEAFEFLIKEKAGLVLPDSIDGKSGDHPDLVRGSTSANETVNSRKAGGQIRKLEDQKVIVDMREFRSELPSLIHRRGIDVIPVTLEIGDYILTPDIVVERKSVSDLIGSLNNGRLYTQAQSMVRLYKRPILLIEFDQNKAFSLQGKYYFNSSSASQNVVSKLILLTTHFPELRILWCPSPYATAEMFELLKAKREQPDEKKAVLMKIEGDEGEMASNKFNSVGTDFISKLPGLNSKNMWSIMRNVSSIADLINYSEEQFSTFLDNSGAAKSLWTSINEEMKTELPPATVMKRTKKPWKFSKKSK